MKTEFKAVVNKVLISTLVITTLLGATATPAFAAEYHGSTPVGTPVLTMPTPSQSQTQEYGVTVETSISNIQNTIAAINAMKSNGSVTSTQLNTLATQLYSLETAVRASGEGASARVVDIINKAEKAISGVSNAKVSDVQTAILVVRASLGIEVENVTVQDNKANSSATQSALKGFKDVAKDRWSHDAIMEMVKIGMFAGTTSPDANGMGTFEPTATMTRAQFITVVTRYLYKDQLDGMKTDNGVAWYNNNYIVAVMKGIVRENEFSYDSLNKPITRQEMAMIMVRACEKIGDTAKDLVPTTRIADYNTIGTYYQLYVRQAFSMGLIAGYDAQGTFGPKDTLTREQGAMVVYRLVNKASRAEVEVGPQFSSEESIAGAITIVEGQTRTNRPARVGDIYIKADGTRITLKLGPSGVLGEGQGVAPDAGLIDSSGNPIKDNTRIYFRVADFGKVLDSANMKYNNQEYQINSITGEGHTTAEWSRMTDNYAKPTREGEYSNERYTADGVCCWVWNVNLRDWLWNP